MPAEKQQQKPALIRQVAARPQTFGFFQATRLLHLQFQQSSSNRSDSGDPSNRIRFKNSRALAFAASEIETAELFFDDASNRTASETDAVASRPPELLRAEVTPAFMGLLGTAGTLPLAYTEMLGRASNRNGESAACTFFDIFSNRSLHLYFAAWKKYRLARRYELDGSSSALAPLLSLAGKSALPPTHAVKPADTTDKVALAQYAGILWRRSPSADSIRQLLTHYFRVPVSIRQFVAQWYAIPESQQSTLSSATSQLGVGAVLGPRVMQCDLRLDLNIGPLALDEYNAFLPGGKAHATLGKLLCSISGVSIEYGVRLSLSRRDVGGLSLSVGTEKGLGSNSFLGGKHCDRDRDDMRYLLNPGASGPQQKPQQGDFRS